MERSGQVPFVTRGHRRPRESFEGGNPMADIADRTQDFGAFFVGEPVIGAGANVVGIDRLCEGWPAGGGRVRG